VEISEDEVKTAALSSPAVQKALEGKEPRQVIVVPGRLVNIVV
jgi:leucyl-tRNA synthetase